MFKNLPNEIIEYIYSYDNTYKEIFKKSLKIIEILPTIISYKRIKNTFEYQNYQNYQNDNIITKSYTKLHNYLEIKFTITKNNEIKKLKKYEKILLIQNGYYKWIFEILPKIEMLDN